VTLEEDALAGGFGSAAMEALAGHGSVPCRAEMAGVADRFVEHGRRGELLDSLGLSAERIAQRVGQLVRGAEAERPWGRRAADLVDKARGVGR